MAHLVSVVLTEATGMTAHEFAAQHLFPFLGIGERTWLRGNRGYNFGGVRLHLSLRDMWRFGELYLNEGRAGGVRVLSNDWVELSTQAQLGTDGYAPFGPAYGYLWWIGEGAPYEFYFANGYGGQFIIAHQTAVAFDIGAEDSGQFTLKFVSVHGIPAPNKKAPMDIQKSLGGFLI